VRAIANLGILVQQAVRDERDPPPLFPTVGKVVAHEASVTAAGTSPPYTKPPYTQRVRRSAVVTGSSSGIGRAIATRLAADGFWVLLADVRRPPLTSGVPTDEVIAAAGGQCEYVQADVSSRGDCDRLVALAVEQTGTLDVLVNNAALAGAHSKPLLETSDDDFDAIIAVNLRGPFLLCRAAVRQMLTQPLRAGARGRIINITSQHGMVGAPGHSAYAVSKGGLVQLTRQVAVEYGRDGVICNAVAPGKIVTGTQGDLSRDAESAAYVQGRTPFGRLGEPADVAAAVAFLASDDASYISGVNLMVDGGWMAY
jgi:glucose 1-dehydrogenase